MKKKVMIDLREKIKSVINEEKRVNHFKVLDDSSAELINQIFKNYEVTNNLKQDFENIPKHAELIFVAAPTGAGKDNLVVKLNVQNPEKNYIELNMDMFRHYFPSFTEDVSKLKDRTFAEQTNQFAYEMYYTIQEILLNEFPGANIIITGTLWKTERVEETFKKYKANKFTDYNIKLVSLAVPYKKSAISIIKRYAKIVDSQINSDDFIPGTSRYTTKEYHDETFERFPDNLEYFEVLFRNNPSELIDSIEVYKRSKNMYDYSENTLIYSSDDPMFAEKTALSVVNQMREKEVEFYKDDILDLLFLISKNKEYMSKQGVLNDIVIDVAQILGFENMIKGRIEGLKDDENEKC